MSKRISKILVCIDGSEYSINAAKQALEIAKSSKSEIIALYVSHIPLSLRHKPREILDAAHEFDLQESENWLKDTRKEAEENNILLKIEAIETTSSTVKSIIDYAESNNIDLIVVGNKGRSKIERALLGSTAAGVINNAKCSVLVTR